MLYLTYSRPPTNHSKDEFGDSLAPVRQWTPQRKQRGGVLGHSADFCYLVLSNVYVEAMRSYVFSGPGIGGANMLPLLKSILGFPIKNVHCFDDGSPVI